MGTGRGGGVSLIASAFDRPLDRAAGGRVHLSGDAARQTGETSRKHGVLHGLGHDNGLPRAGNGGVHQHAVGSQLHGEGRVGRGAHAGVYDERHARKLTQVRVAKKLGITQDSVSRLEKRSDILLSTLRKTVEAMGGSLSLIAEFPDRAPVVLSGIAEDDPEPKPTRRRHARA